MRKEICHISSTKELRAFMKAMSINNEFSFYDFTEEIHIHRYGTNDYSIYFKNGDWSSRGNRKDVIKEYEEWRIQMLISEEFSSNPNIEFIV